MYSARDDTYRRPLTRPISDTFEDDEPREKACSRDCRNALLCLAVAVLLCSTVAFAVLWRVAVGQRVDDINGQEDIQVRRALINLFFSTNPNGTAWTTCDSGSEPGERWVSREHYCRWKCVNCDDDTKAVTGLYLKGTGLSGTVPDDIGLVTSLQFLDLSENFGLRGTLPASMGNLAQLQKFGFNSTRISGSLPATLAAISTLTHLAASGARLEGHIPPMPSLHSLQLQYNERISGTLPATLPTAYLDLTGNAISGSLPSTLSTPYVALDANRLTGVLPASYGAVRVLKIRGNCEGGKPPQGVNLAQGGDPVERAKPGPAAPKDAVCLTGFLPDGLREAEALEVIELENNQLSGTLTASLAGLGNLQYLKLRGNDLSGSLPAGLGRLSDHCSDNCCDISDNCFDPSPTVCSPGAQHACAKPQPQPTPTPTPHESPPAPPPSPPHKPHHTF